MTAKDIVLDHAPEWTEEQAEVALLAAEGSRVAEKASRLSDHRALMERAAAFRARQPEVIDAAVQIREAREALGRRGS
jgi:hypothetical protein